MYFKDPPFKGLCLGSDNYDNVEQQLLLLCWGDNVAGKHNATTTAMYYYVGQCSNVGQS